MQGDGTVTKITLILTLMGVSCFDPNTSGHPAKHTGDKVINVLFHDLGTLNPSTETSVLRRPSYRKITALWVPHQFATSWVTLQFNGYVCNDNNNHAALLGLLIC